MTIADRIIDQILEGTGLVGKRFRSSPSERAWQVTSLGQRDDGKPIVTIQRGTEIKTILRTTFTQHYHLVGGDLDRPLVEDFTRHRYKVVEP